MSFNFVPINLSGLLFLMSLGTAVPYPGLLLGALALAIVRQVGLADCSGCCAVGHVLVSVMAAGDPVHIDHNGLVNLEAANGSALVTDGQVVVAALDHYQGRDEVG